MQNDSKPQCSKQDRKSLQQRLSHQRDDFDTIPAFVAECDRESGTTQQHHSIAYMPGRRRSNASDELSPVAEATSRLPEAVEAVETVHTASTAMSTAPILPMPPPVPARAPPLD